MAAHAEAAHAPAAGHAPAAEGHTGGQQHPLGIYFAIWVLLFVLSAASYMIDYLQFHGMLRWTLIITFMLLKAGFIVAIFMHMRWERLALMMAILLPPLCLLIFIGLMSIEGGTTNESRKEFYVATEQTKVAHTTEHQTE